MKLTPKAKRNISRIIPFAIIWLLIGWIIDITVYDVTRNQNLNPDTDISFTIPVLIFASLANVLVGLIVGVLEVVYLEKRFSNRTLRAKFFYKFLTYLTLFIIIIVLLFPVAFSLETGISLLEVDAWQKLGRFVISISFLTTLFHLSVKLMVSLIYSAISESLGHQVLLNFFSGKYHQPKIEKRIFMFLDMKSSTTIAEKLGHIKYFKLLGAYYNIMSDPIINSFGEVYQYIGDEIVISWKPDRGINQANCIKCFFDIRDHLNKQKEDLLREFGFEIGFKAGIHFGEVTIGEIGALKKEIVFTGDVLNTTARIQSLCNELKSDLLISGAVKELLPQTEYQYGSKGEIELKGRNKKEELFSVTSEKKSSITNNS
ncbi:adenylate/guanylate cyclase domain-containing protein [Reichenbachiella sp.]|uniref:adenylate/guanylate cyclase domain-containing protein n=1 Tax=Reichenbachiella sp. TaxID=2184521 RepID=UPI003B5A0D87